MWENVRKAVASVLVFAVLLANMGENIFASELSDDILDAEVTSEETEPEMMDAELEEAELGTEILELETEEEGVGTEFDELDVMQTQDMDDTVYINEIEKAESENGLEEEELEKKSYGSNVEWKWDNITKTLTFSGEGTIDQYDFPDEYEKMVECVVIESKITEIDSYTFCECTNLQTVEALGVTKIGYGAFEKCLSLIDVKIPSVVELNADAFKWCEKLTMVSFPVLEVLGSYVFMGCKNLQNVNLPSVMEIGIRVFDYCDSSKLCEQNGMLILGNAVCLADNDKLLENIVIPDNVTQIKGYAFKDCNKLKSVQALGLELVEAHSFEGCENLYNADGMIVINHILCDVKNKELETLVLPDDVHKMVDIFDGYNNVKEVQGNNVVEVGDEAFEYCKSLKRVDFPKVKKIGKDAFYSSALETANFPALEKIDDNAFQHCTLLKTMNASNVQEIGKYAFSSTALETAYFPKVKVVKTYAFYQCKNLKKVICPNLTRAGSSCFCECILLEQLDISHLTYIYGWMFSGCVNLKREGIKVSEELEPIAEGTSFQNTNVDYLVSGGRLIVANHENLPEELVLNNEVKYILGTYE